MTTQYRGSFIYIHFNANELNSGGHTSVELPDGNKYNVIPSDQFK